MQQGESLCSPVPHEKTYFANVDQSASVVGGQRVAGAVRQVPTSSLGAAVTPSLLVRLHLPWHESHRPHHFAGSVERK